MLCRSIFRLILNVRLWLACSSFAAAIGAAQDALQVQPVPSPNRNGATQNQPAQNESAPSSDASPTDSQKSSFQAVNAPIDVILSEYESLTGKILIKDSNLSANALPITISVPNPIPNTELVHLIEAALLLNNYALIPASEPNTEKVININTGKNPRSEGVKLYSTPDSLPSGEQVVSYYMPFKYVSANEALTIFQTHVLPRAYTSFVPINSSQALLITESTSVIRQLIGLKNLIDTPPAQTITQFVPLVRADAERVAQTINKLLEAEQKSKEGGAAQVAAPQGQPVTSSTAAETSTGIPGVAQLVPDTRTNRILLVCRPQQLHYLRGLIEDFDKEVGLAKPLEYRLKYISAADVLPVLSDVLAEDQKQAEQAHSAASQGQSQQGGTSQNRSASVNFGNSGSSFGGNNNSSSSSYGSNGLGGSSGGGYGSNQGQSLLQEPDQPAGPQSIIVGKTRVISDSKDNLILVIGPPESIQRVRAVLDRLDQRPQQVYLATVIGELTLDNTTDFGVDFTQTFKKLGGGNGFASQNTNTPLNTSGTDIVDPRSLHTTGDLANNLSGLTIYGSISDAVRVFVRATDTRNNFRILSRPSVYTANNKLAEISSGQQIPYAGSSLTGITSGTTGPINNSTTSSVESTVEFANVGLTLDVIPLINSNHEVTLKVAQVNDSSAGTVTISGNETPEINSQHLTTTVTVPSGATVVLGGLIQNNVNKTDSGIPYLDRIPYLSYLFKYHTEEHKRTELIIFIQPVIVRDNWETLVQSIKEERRMKVSGQMRSFARPDDFAEPEATPRHNRHFKSQQ